MNLDDNELLEIWNEGMLIKNKSESVTSKLKDLRDKIDRDPGLTKNQRKKMKKKKKKQENRQNNFIRESRRKDESTAVPSELKE